VDIAGARILLDGSIAWHVALIPTTAHDENPDVAVHQPGSRSVAWMQEPDEARWTCTATAAGSPS
jgi:hypothetical protein